MPRKKGRLVLAGGAAPKLRRPRKGDFDAARQDRFLAALAATCNVCAACRSARVARSIVYYRRETDAAFRARWAGAVREAYAQLELMMLERMMNGTVKTITRADGSVERIHEYPNTVALTLLRLHRETAAEAAAEIDPEDIEEVRLRLADKLARLRRRLEKKAAAESEGKAE